MFTGLIQGVAEVSAVRTRANYRIFTIAADLPGEALVLGESVACDGACLTVVETALNAFVVEASQESLEKTIQKKYRVGTKINLERALRVGDRLGGHFVSGHVDDVGGVERLRRIGDSLELVLTFNSRFDALVIEKGSIAVNGISLTVNTVGPGRMSVNLIPHTAAETTISRLRAGDGVNLEFDLIGKYILKSRGQAEETALTFEKFNESGW